EHAVRAGAAEGTRRGRGRPRAPLAGIPAKIRRERDREMGGADQGRRRHRGVTHDRPIGPRGKPMPSIRTVAAVAALVAATAPAAAQTWPTRPMIMVVPYPAGAGVDVLGRILSPRLSDLLGQQVIVENI